VTAVHSTTGKPRHFIVFSDDWGIHPSSSQHIFRHIAESHCISWINTVGMRRPRLNMTDIRKARRKLAGMFALQSGHSSAATPANIDVHQPFMIPFNDVGFVRRLNSASVTRDVHSTMNWSDMESPILVTTIPSACDYVDSFPGATVVYYCVDDFSEWPGLDKSLVLEMEATLVEKADLFIATSRSLFARLEKSGKPTYLLPHGVDIELFSTDVAAEHQVLRDIPSPRAGYFGLFDDRSDQDLISSVATENPEVSFVIAGRVETSVERLRSLPNVYFVGLIDYADLPALIQGIDVLFIPYKVDALSESMSPLKLKEYLVTGRPIISTPIAAAKEMQELMSIASSPDGWNRSLKDGMRSDRCRRREQMVARLAGESWAHKAEQFVNICYGRSADTKASSGERAADGG